MKDKKYEYKLAAGTETDWARRMLDGESLYNFKRNRIFWEAGAFWVAVGMNDKLIWVLPSKLYERVERFNELMSEE